MKEVVEDEQRVDCHHHSIREMPIIIWSRRQLFERAHDVVTPESHCATSEAWQAGQLERTVIAQERAEMVERCGIGRNSGPLGWAHGAFHMQPVIPMHGSGFGGEERVARPPLAALERFEQESKSTPMQLCKRR